MSSVCFVLYLCFLVVVGFYNYMCVPGDSANKMSNRLYILYMYGLNKRCILLFTQAVLLIHVINLIHRIQFELQQSCYSCVYLLLVSSKRTC